MIEASRYIDMDRGILTPAVFADPAIYALEQERVFGRCWQFLTHESLVKKPGDFVLAYMGEDPVVVVRQNDGTLRAFLNQCRHRGAPVCRAEQGQIGAFVCPFHGWTYDRGGQLVNVPHEKEYVGGVDKPAWGLKPVAQLDSYKGLVFATWDSQAPSLAEYLGDMAWYMDAFLDAYEGGTEVVGGVHKWVVPANWKFGAEQFAHDVCHAEFAHGSVLRIPPGRDRRDLHRSPANVTFSSSQGHGCAVMDFPFPRPPGPLTDWVTRMVPQAVQRLGERGKALSQSGIYTVFPNFSVFSSSPTMRVWVPRGPDEMEIWAWTLVPAAAPGEVKEAMRLNNLRTFSPAGTFEQDDGEIWGDIQRVLKGWAARRNTLNYQMDMGRAREGVAGNPGKTSWMESELPARGFHRRWVDLMESPDWAEVARREAVLARAELSAAAAGR